MLSGHLALPTAMSPYEWHVHELVFGYVPAVVAGFLLTAVPNWTGRLPVVGRPLALLAAWWLAGRIAVATSAWIGAVPAAIVDATFLLVFGLVVAREIVAGQNWRNLKILVAVGLLLAANVLFHLESNAGHGVGYGMRLGISAILLLIMLVGGRIIPSFTRNWLVRRPAGRLPIPFSQLDAVAIVASGTALALWTVMPTSLLTAWMALAAALLNIGRQVRWAGDRTAAEPLVLILHVAYAFVPLGFCLLALSIWRPTLILASGAIHAWTAGAIGLMTLAVMTRASLGHTSQPLTATRSTLAIYSLAIVAALTRAVAAFDVHRDPMLQASAAAWVAAFGGFVIFYAPLLLRQGEHQVR
jgi:uncharacterized protein involved in response to NO